jgi:alkylation response protein AidB-like acyl-CoA dehydrogenase
MDLSYTEEQELFRKSVRDFVQKRVTPERLGQVADGDGWDPALWKEAVGLGIAGVSVPEEHGGAGLGFVEEAIVAEELGRGLFPGPWLGTVVMAQPALARRPDLLAAVASGERIATLVGLDEPAIEGEPFRYAVDLDAADLLVVRTLEGLYEIDKDRADWRVLPTVDGTRRLGEVTAGPRDGELLASGDEALVIAEQTWVRSLAALAAEAVGVAAQAVDLTVEHARQREQFGKAIGSFQAVSHQIADAYMETENARSLAMWAAASIDGGEPDARLAAETAAAFASAAAIHACERAIQVHGGIGFSWEHVLHRYYKRARWISAYLDGSQTWQAVADSMIDGTAYPV